MSDETGNEERARDGGGWQPTPQGEYDGDATAFVHLPPDAGLDGIPLEAPGHGYVPPHIADPHATAQWNFHSAMDAEHPPAPGPADLTGQWTIPVAQGELPEESGEYRMGGERYGTAQGYASGYGADDQAYGGAGEQAYDGGGEQYGTPEQYGAPEQYGTSGEYASGQYGTPAQGTPVQVTPAYGTPVHEVLADGTPAHGTPVREEPAAYGQGQAPATGHESPRESAHPHEAPAPAHPGVPSWANGGNAPATLPGGAPAPWALTPQETPEAPAGGGRQAPEAAEVPGGDAHMRAQAPAAEATAAEEHPVAEAPGAPVGPEEAPDAEAPEAAAPTGTHPADAPEADGPATEQHPAQAPPAEPTAPAADTPASEAPASEAPASEAPAADAPAAEAAAAPAPPAEAPTTEAPATEAPAAEAPATEAPAAEVPAAPSDEHPHMSYVLRVNGADRPVTDAWIGESLLYVLRERLGLAGAKDGCSQGECGACNVQVDGRLVASCLVPAATAAGSEVRTVEGLAVDGEPSDVQRALTRCGAVQCGFCIPGMAMTVHDLLEGNHAPSEVQARQALSGNLCRCTGYQGALRAVREVVAERAAGKSAQAAGNAAPDDAHQNPDARIPHQVPHPHDGGTA
ncbi:2Fe-2S iron-sulfur cluster-binding protein [Streptomyces sp. NPDC095602]|uniref:(2Fe-2S)-binding protein n=1 Tax=Streptomyces sp. NPDC095602 TaxID=3155819 RepID=UPI00331C18C2